MGFHLEFCDSPKLSERQASQLSQLSAERNVSNVGDLESADKKDRHQHTQQLRLMFDNTRLLAIQEFGSQMSDIQNHGAAASEQSLGFDQPNYQLDNNDFKYRLQLATGVSGTNATSIGTSPTRTSPTDTTFTERSTHTQRTADTKYSEYGEYGVAEDERFMRRIPIEVRDKNGELHTIAASVDTGTASSFISKQAVDLKGFTERPLLLHDVMEFRSRVSGEMYKPKTFVQVSVKCEQIGLDDFVTANLRVLYDRGFDIIFGIPFITKHKILAKLPSRQLHMKKDPFGSGNQDSEVASAARREKAEAAEREERKRVLALERSRLAELSPLGRGQNTPRAPKLSSPAPTQDKDKGKSKSIESDASWSLTTSADTRKTTTPFDFGEDPKKS